MEISENSRVWIYQADRMFSNAEEEEILERLNAFTAKWLAHGHQLTAKGEVRYHRFILLMVDESRAGATGCSIDKSVNVMKEIEQDFSVNLFDRFNIAYHDGEKIESCSRDQFEEKMRLGIITANTIVFNNLVQTVKDMQHAWELPLRDSWHANVFADFIKA